MSNQEYQNTRSKNLSFRCSKRSYQSIALLLVIALLSACEEEQNIVKPNPIDTHISKTGVPQKVDLNKEKNGDQSEHKKLKPQIVAVVPEPEPMPYPEPDPYPEPFRLYEPEPQPEPVWEERIIENVDPIVSIAEKMPEFPGGQSELFKFINTNIQYPQFEKENEIQGNVYVRFTITEEGLVKDPKILKSVNGAPNFDKEVIRVIKLMPNWIPGENAGKKVSVYFTMPVKFKLD